jgi:hypothetical protein
MHQVSNPAVVLRSLWNLRLSGKKAGDSPPIETLVRNAKVHTLRKEMYFLHVGDRRGSLGSSDGGGTRTMFVVPR